MIRQRTLPQAEEITLRLETQKLEARRVMAGVAGLVSGLAMVLQLMVAIPGIGSIPSPFLLPFLPVTVIGLLYWLGSGRFRESIAVWLIFAVVVVGLLWSNHIALGIFLVIAVLSMIAISAVILDETDWLLAARFFTLGFLTGTATIFLSHRFPSAFLIVPEERFGWMRSQGGIVIMDPNQAGFHAGFAILIALTLLSRKRGPEVSRLDQSLAATAIGVATLTILLTQSRGALVAIVGAIGTVIVLGRVIYKWRTWVSTILALIVAGIAIIASEPAILQRFTREDVSTANGRTIIWERAVQYAFSDLPVLLFGSGSMDGAFALGKDSPELASLLSWGAPPTVEMAGQSPAIGIHSTFVSWLLDYGLLGCGIAVIALMFAWLRAWLIDQGKPLALAQGMIMFFLLVSVSLTAYLLNGVSIAAGGMTLAYLYHRRQSSAPSLLPDQQVSGRWFSSSALE